MCHIIARKFARSAICRRSGILAYDERTYTVKCKVFDTARRQSRGMAFLCAAEIGIPRESDFVLPFFLLFFFFLTSLPVANYFARNCLETKRPPTPSRCVSQCFVISITRYLSSCARAGGEDGAAYIAVLAYPGIIL